MLRESELAKAIELEQEIGHRRRVGHFGLDAHRAIGPQIRSINEKTKTAIKRKTFPGLRLGSFQEIEGPGGHITYKFVKTKGRKR